MEDYMPLPDLASELRGGVTPEQMYIEDMEYIAEEMYDFLPKLELPDKWRLKLIALYTKELEKFKKCPTAFQMMVKEHWERNTVEQRRVASLRVPEIVKDEGRIKEMFEMSELVKRWLLDHKYPAYLRLTIDRCLQRVRFSLGKKTINCTRGMWRSVKMIKLGTEKEREHDAKFFILLGVINLKEAVDEEFARAHAK